MVNETKVSKRAATRRRRRGVEPILIGLVLLWALIVFGVLIYATILQNQRGIDLMPTAIPSPKS